MKRFLRLMQTIVIVAVVEIKSKYTYFFLININIYSFYLTKDIYL
jgi:hypothetical protein